MLSLVHPRWVKPLQHAFKQALLAACLGSAVWWTWTLGQSNLDRTHQLALERYGQRAADL